jgi:F0F1-type ATP synthase membrane subunit b/b'
MEELLKNFDLVPMDVPMILLGSVLFIVLWSTLKRALFDPYLKIVELREGMTSGASTTAVEMRAAATKAEEAAAQKIMEARVQVHKERLAAITAAQKSASQVLVDAETKAQEIVRGSRWQLEQSTAAMRSEAHKEVGSLVKLVLQKIGAGSLAH